MKAGTYNIQCDQGSTFSLTMTLTDADNIIYNLSGYTARMQVRRSFDATTVMVELTTENGGITIDGDAGKITLDMDADTTAGLSTSGVYDIEIIAPTGEVYKPIKGDFILSLEVTR